jgi:SAM-dependent methyltransferase
MQQSLTREQKEAAFHDARIDTADETRKLGYAYASVRDVYAFTNVPPDRMAGSVLELGCFRGDRACALDGFSGRFVGIDISPSAVEHCRTRGLPSNFQFRVDNANVLATIPDESVDYAFGDGVLHHLDLELLGPALARKLSPGGYARFIEPAQGNFLLRAFRRLTPQMRTPDEHPFDRASIELLQRHFHVTIRHQALLRPLLPMLFFNSALVTRAVRWLDARLLANPFLQRQAWLLMIELRRKC